MSVGLCFLSDFIDTLTLSNHLSLLQGFREYSYISILFCTAYKYNSFYILHFNDVTSSLLSLEKITLRK
jgi:hypothetical protein